MNNLKELLGEVKNVIHLFEKIVNNVVPEIYIGLLAFICIHSLGQETFGYSAILIVLTIGYVVRFIRKGQVLKYKLAYKSAKSVFDEYKVIQENKCVSQSIIEGLCQKINTFYPVSENAAQALVVYDNCYVFNSERFNKLIQKSIGLFGNEIWLSKRNSQYYITLSEQFKIKIKNCISDYQKGKRIGLSYAPLDVFINNLKIERTIQDEHCPSSSHHS